MRLLLVHSGADLYGASRSFLRLTSRLVADGHEVLAVLPYAGPLVTQLEQNGVRTRIDPHLAVLTRERFASKSLFVQRALADSVRSVQRLRAWIREFRPELVHTNTAVAISSPIAAKVSGVPHIWHVREFFSDFPRLWPLYQRFMASFSDVIVCVSSAVRDQFAPLLQRKCVVLHNGFPAAEFEGISAERIGEFKARFGLDGQLTIGLVGRIKFGRKGQDIFAHAVAQLAPSFPNARFLCIGSPFPGNEEHLHGLFQLIERLGIAQQFVYTGDVDDIKAAYLALDVSVLASTQPEPFGGVVIESMALGRPVVGTAIGGTPEQIEEGVTGFLVPPGDSAAMAEAIAKLLECPELRERLGDAGRRRFESHFEFEPFYQKLTKLYRDVAKRDAYV